MIICSCGTHLVHLSMFCCILVSYTKGWLRGCCIAVNKVHEICQCEGDVSFCKKACDDDKKCVGYADKIRFHRHMCEIATTSDCPKTKKCNKFNKGSVGNLLVEVSCGKGMVDACYIKDTKGRLLNPI